MRFSEDLKKKVLFITNVQRYIPSRPVYVVFLPYTTCITQLYWVFSSCCFMSCTPRLRLLRNCFCHSAIWTLLPRQQTCDCCWAVSLQELERAKHFTIPSIASGCWDNHWTVVQNSSAECSFVEDRLEKSFCIGALLSSSGNSWWYTGRKGRFKKAFNNCWSNQIQKCSSNTTLVIHTLTAFSFRDTRYITSIGRVEW